MVRGRPSVSERADRNLHIRCLEDDLVSIKSSVRKVKELIPVLRKNGFPEELPARTSGSIICHALYHYCEYMDSVLQQASKVSEQRDRIFSILSEDPSADVSFICDSVGCSRSFVYRCIRQFNKDRR